jgi:hypothetical protein
VLLLLAISCLSNNKKVIVLSQLSGPKERRDTKGVISIYPESVWYISL